MAHMVRQMMYVGEVPWHRLGTPLLNLATSAEAIKVAGLDFEVSKMPLQTVIKPGLSVPVTDHFATVRMDTKEVLGVVGKRYTVLQNANAFTFFDSLVGEGEAIYETAGALGIGERIWILAKLPTYIKVGGKDIVDKYLLLSNSHDGSSIVRAKLTPIRVVCHNTLTMALAGSEQEVRIRHTANAQDKLDAAHKVLGLTNEVYRQLEEIFNQMAKTPVNDKQLVEYLKVLVPDNEEASRTTRTENIRNQILNLHESGAGSDMARGTLWGAYNAVTEYVDHVGNADWGKKLNSMWFGTGAKLKIEAFNEAKKFMLN